MRCLLVGAATDRLLRRRTRSPGTGWRRNKLTFARFLIIQKVRGMEYLRTSRITTARRFLVYTRIHPTLRLLATVFPIFAVLGISGCATTNGMRGGPPAIAEGMGRLVLETAGIDAINYYVIDEETDEEVYSQSPRLPGSSPLGYERGGRSEPQWVDLPPGTYTVVAETDVDDIVEKKNIRVTMGETQHITVPVGRFQLIYFDQSGTRRQVPFLIYDQEGRTVLGRGMTSTELRYFIMPEGEYKVRIESAASERDEIRPVQIGFGRTQQITIGSPEVEEDPGEGRREDW